MAENSRNSCRYAIGDRDTDVAQNGVDSESDTLSATGIATSSFPGYSCLVRQRIGWVEMTEVTVAPAGKGTIAIVPTAVFTVFSFASGVRGYFAPFYPDSPFLGVAGSVVISLIALAVIVKLSGLVRGRRPATSKHPIPILVLIGALLLGIGLGAGYLGAAAYNQFHDPVTIVKPVTGTKYLDQKILLEVQYVVTDTSNNLCDGHLWLIDDEPSGRDGEVLHIARQELPCDEAKRSLRFYLTPWPTHTLTVYRLVGDDQEWATTNRSDWITGNSKDDGRWVHLPASATIVSNVVNLALVAG